LIGLSCLSAVVSAAPFSFGNNPVGNGFPTVANPSSQLTTIEAAAHGSLPNGPPPPSAPSANSLTSLKLIAFNELFEVAFFTDLIANITNNVAGYTFRTNHAKQSVLTKLAAIQAQEQLHELNANGAVAKFAGEAIKPCQYTFPVTTFHDAIALASTFTDVVLGTLQDVQSLFGSGKISSLPKLDDNADEYQTEILVLSAVSLQSSAKRENKMASSDWRRERFPVPFHF